MKSITFSNDTVTTETSSSSYWDSSDEACMNAVKNFHIDIIYNAVDGMIVSSEIYLKLTDVKMSDVRVVQTFSLSFKPNSNNFFERSGYPGYIFGSPVLISFDLHDKTSFPFNLNIMDSGTCKEVSSHGSVS